jgi:hypothetical protein
VSCRPHYLMTFLDVSILPSSLSDDILGCQYPAVLII